MKIDYSDHAKKRMKQRGITELEIEYVLEHPDYVKNRLREERKHQAGLKIG